MDEHHDDAPPDDWLSRIEFWVTASTLAFAAVLVLLTIILRYMFSYSISAFDELTRYAIVLGTFVAASRLLQQERHVTVDVLLIILPKKLRPFLKLFSFTAGAVFSVILLYTSLMFVIQTYDIGMRSMSNLRMPMWIPYMSIPIGALLLLIRFLQKIWTTVKRGNS